MLAVVAAVLLLRRESPEPAVVERFDGPDRLLSNEYAHWNPDAEGRRVDPTWVVTAGSLFVRDGRGWTGPPDTAPPDATSERSTGSATFRAHTRRDDLSDVTVRLRYRVVRYLSAAEARTHPWDGAHLLLRHDSERQLYAVTLARRDGRIDVKRKLPGGRSNGGEYTTLGEVLLGGSGVGEDHEATVHLTTQRDGTTDIEVVIDGTTVVAARDPGRDGRASLSPGAIGIRSDNVELEIDDVVVEDES